VVTEKQLRAEFEVWERALRALRTPTAREEGTLRSIGLSVQVELYLRAHRQVHDSYLCSSTRSGGTCGGSAGSEV
jgi:hypothetical protein